MKKLFVLGLSLSLLTGAVMFSSHASRDAYHNYISNKAKQEGQYRRHTDGNKRVSRYRYPRRTFPEYTRYSRKNYLYPTGSKRNLFGSTANETNNTLSLRTVSERRGVYHNDYPVAMAALRRTVRDLKIPMETFENSDISINFPRTWSAEFVGDQFMPRTNSTVQFRVKKYESVCEQRNFTACANSVIRTENRLQNQEILRDYVNRIHRTGGQFDNFLGEKTRAGFYEESVVTRRQQTYEFVAQRVVEGMDGDAYYLELVAPERQSAYAIPLAKKVFESFRIVRAS